MKRLNHHINKRVVIEYRKNGYHHTLHGIITSVSKKYVMFFLFDADEFPILRDKILSVKPIKLNGYESDLK